ncbi:helix-turn-helix domain-containing protein [Deinococcus wulumuqiensis]|uniref:helix-turn-helix domain-containing protein n=1 Tax=Deinococcus wulumuqiensis TaxID=980427 RepID=UPI0013C2C998
MRYQPLLRLELARSLLSDPSLSLEQVATRVGFQDARHFRQLWVREYGTSPSHQRPRG